MLGIPSRRLRTIQGILLWSRRVAVLARSTDAEFIWCGNVKPAAYPAKWTMERTGVPYGILLHGGDLLILQHQIHQSAMKRTAAAALLFVPYRGKVQLVDGWHRLYRALMTGIDLLPAYILTPEETQQILVCCLPPGKGFDLK